MTGSKQTRWAPWLVVLLLAGLVVALVVRDRVQPPPVVESSQVVRLRLDITQNLALAAKTDFGEPPQIAVWLEPLPNGRPRTIYVSHRAGTGDWLDKSDCPDALPRWFAAYRAEHGLKSGLPTPQNPLPDAIARPTPHEPSIGIETTHAPRSRWRIWVEVNLSADYNDTFPAVDQNGMDDLHANGQPSLLYTAELTATPGVQPELMLVARTVPNSLAAETSTDLSGITTARHILTALDLRLE